MLQPVVALWLPSSRKESIFCRISLFPPNHLYQLSELSFCCARCRAKPIKTRDFGPLPRRWHTRNIVTARIQTNGCRFQQCVRHFGRINP